MSRRAKNIHINESLLGVFKLLFGLFFLAIDIVLVFLLRNKTMIWEWIWLPLIGISFSAMWYVMKDELFDSDSIIGKIFKFLIIVWYLVRGAIVTKYLFGDEEIHFAINAIFWRAVLNSIGVVFIILTLFDIEIEIDEIKIYLPHIFLTSLDILMTFLFKNALSKWAFIWLPLIGLIIGIILGAIDKDNSIDFSDGFGSFLSLVYLLWGIARAFIIAIGYFVNYDGCFVVSKSFVVLVLNATGLLAYFGIVGQEFDN